MIYLKLFLCYFQIGLFSIGGGHASIALIQEMVVESRGWLTMTEFVDMITIAEMTPGPFALNSATFVGIKMGGISGGALATFSCMLPSFLIVVILVYIYKKYKTFPAVRGALSGIQPAATALITGAGISLLFLALFGTNVITDIKTPDLTALALLVISFIILRIKKVNYVLIILITGIAGAAVYIILGALQ